MTRRQTVRPKAGYRSLAEFVAAEKRANCPVCQLPPAIREGMIDARSKAYKRATVLRWLQVECGVKLTSADLDRHYSGKHEQHG